MLHQASSPTITGAGTMAHGRTTANPQDEPRRGIADGCWRAPIATTYPRARRVSASRAGLAQPWRWTGTDPTQTVTVSSQTARGQSRATRWSSPHSKRGERARMLRLIASAGGRASVGLVSSWLDMEIALAAGLLSKY
jgi:hypothetical protein